LYNLLTCSHSVSPDTKAPSIAGGAFVVSGKGGRARTEKIPTVITVGILLLLLGSAADGIAHFADMLHGLGQILHDLHSLITSKSGVVCKLQIADAGGHLTDVLHGLYNILLHRHNQYPPEIL